NNRQVEFFKSPSKRSFSLPKANGLSKDESIEEQGMEREYDSTQRNPSRALLVVGSDGEELRDDFRSENSRSSNGFKCISEGMRSDSGTINRGFFSPTWRMEQRTETLDIQQEGDESHILRTIPLRKNLQKVANQSDPHQTRHIPGISNKITNTLSKLSTQGDQSAMKEIFRALCLAWQIIPTLDLFATGENKLVDRFLTIGEKEQEDEEEADPDRLGKVQSKISHDSTQVARSNKIHTLANRQQYIPYFWRELSDSEPGEGDDEKEGHATTRKNRGIPHGPRVEQGRKLLTEFLDNINMARYTQKMIIDGQKYDNQKKYTQIMGENKENKDIISKRHATILNTMLFFIFGAVQRVRPEISLLQNEELQTKLASLLKSLCFLRKEEMANIDLSVSIIDDQEQRAAICIPPKQSVQRERYDVRKTDEPKVCPTETFFVWLTRLREHFQQGPTNFIHLFWTENWKRADQRYISTRLERLVQTLGVQNATANSIRHASSTELAAQGFDWRTINCFTHHTPDSKMNNKFYVFAVNKEQDSIASALVKNHGMKQATQ
ncbi:MAG: hypothetical protein EZS28_038975, partial [Streblomastix strix]